MPRNPNDSEIRLPNGDFLIVYTKDRDPKVEEAFRAAKDRARASIRLRFEQLQQTQQAA